MSATRSGESVLVVGGSTGIGRVTCELLRDRGYRVIATARESADLHELQSSGFAVIKLELRDEGSVARASDQIVALLAGQPLKACFANAGYGLQVAFEDLSRQWLRDQFESNLFGHVQLIQALLGSGALCAGSRVIWNSSVLGYSYLPFRAAYVASKYAMEGLANVMRLELRERGIVTVLIQPGPIDSRFRANALKKLGQALPAEKLSVTGPYAGLVARLARPDGQPGTLSSMHVAKVVMTAIEARRPRARYRVTANAKIMAWAARLLPTAWLDILLSAAVRK